MTTLPPRRKRVIRRLDAEAAQREFVKQENTTYYQNASEWKQPRGFATKRGGREGQNHAQ